MPVCVYCKNTTQKRKRLDGAQNLVFRGQSAMANANTLIGYNEFLDLN
jgi:hypothetical protein